MAAFRFGDAGNDFGAVVAGGLLVDTGAVFYAATFGVRRCEIEPADAGEAYGGGTHGARLEGYVHVAIGQAGGIALSACFADGEDFGVGGGVGGGFGEVVGDA